MTDILIIDSPPVLPVSDLITIAPHADAGLMVVRTLWTPRRAVKQTVLQLQRIGFRVLGAIANGASHKHGYYSHYYGYYSGRYTYHTDGDTESGGAAASTAAVHGGMAAWMRDVRFALPRMAAWGGSAVRYCLRSPLVWFLVIALVALLIVERRLAMSRQGTSGGIELLAPGPAAGSDPVTVTARSEAMAPDRRDLAEALDEWGKALSTQNMDRALTFYDGERFGWLAGDTVDRGSTALRRVLSEFSDGGIMVRSLDIGVFAPPSCSTYAQLSLSDGRSRRLTMAWYRDVRGWRIVGHSWEDGEGP